MSYPSGQGQLGALIASNGMRSHCHGGVPYQVHSAPDPAGGQRPDYAQVQLPGGEALPIGATVVLEMRDDLVLECVVEQQEAPAYHCQLRVTGEPSFP